MGCWIIHWEKSLIYMLDYHRNQLSTRNMFRKSVIRSILSLSISLLGWQFVAAQSVAESAVPQAVRSSFAQSSSGAKATWSKAGNGYEASFLKDGKTFAYVYDNAGQLQLKKMATTDQALPDPVKAKLKQQYGSAKVSDAWQVMNRQKQTYFEVFVTQPDSISRLRYAPNGALLAKSSKAGTHAQVAATQPKVSPPAETPAVKPTVAQNNPAPTKATEPVANSNPPAKSANNPTPVKASEPVVAMRGQSNAAPVKNEIYEDDYDFEADLEEEVEVEEEDITLPDDVEDDWDIEENFEEDDTDIDSIGGDDGDLLD